MGLKSARNSWKKQQNIVKLPTISAIFKPTISAAASSRTAPTVTTNTEEVDAGVGTDAPADSPRSPTLSISAAGTNGKDPDSPGPAWPQPNRWMRKRQLGLIVLGVHVCIETITGINVMLEGPLSKGPTPFFAGGPWDFQLPLTGMITS